MSCFFYFFKLLAEEIKKENDTKDKSERTPFVIKSNLDKVIPINVARKA